jgi:NodT family efflux transporter outer membrane factor (OMF) lipoprotein
LVKREIVLLIAMLWLSACAGPRQEAPASAAVTPPSAWRGGSGSGADVTPGWWRTFGDAALERIVETALANNVDVAIAVARVDEARAQFRVTRSQELPQVGISASGDRERFLSPFATGAYQTAGQVELAISYDLDLFGRARNTTASARAALLATEGARDNVLLAVASTAASGYIDLRALDARLIVLQETLAARAASLEIAQRQARAGYATQLELDQAEAEYRGTEQQIPAIQLAIARQEDGLSLLLGDNPRAIERGVILSELSTPPIPSTVPSALLRRRPDIFEAEQQIVAADRSLDAARAAFMPSIELSTTGGFVASTLITGNPIAIFSLGGSILAPIYEGGRLRAQADAAASVRDQAAFAYRKTALTAFSEVEDALAAAQHSSEQEIVLRQERDALARALVQATRRYQAGYSSYLEQLDAQRGLLSSQLAIVQARADRLNAAVGLFRALGGGWTAGSAQDLANPSSE